MSSYQLSKLSEEEAAVQAAHEKEIAEIRAEGEAARKRRRERRQQQQQQRALPAAASSSSAPAVPADKQLQPSQDAQREAAAEAAHQKKVAELDVRAEAAKLELREQRRIREQKAAKRAREVEVAEARVMELRRLLEEEDEESDAGVTLPGMAPAAAPADPRGNANNIFAGRGRGGLGGHTGRGGFGGRGGLRGGRGV